jgi:hypothetical protein
VLKSTKSKPGSSLIELDKDPPKAVPIWDLPTRRDEHVKIVSTIQSALLSSAS